MFVTLWGMKILLASSNPHKVQEISAAWESLSDQNTAPAFELVGLGTLALSIDEPVEDQPTFEANAVLKARYYAKAASMLTLADDSGLEVDALGGEPGVHSARYSGAGGPRHVVDQANNRLLIDRLADTPPSQRTARFVCTMALVAPEGKQPGQVGMVLAVIRGSVEGRILTHDEAGPDVRGRGEHGFGYDPLFFVAEQDKTTAELSPQQKNAISHRGRAARLMWDRLASLA